MDSKLKTLEILLERMIVLYERMDGILSRERSALILLDFDAILSEMREKDEIASALRGLDRDRLRIQDQFAILMQRDPQELTLRSLAEALIEQGASAREAGVKLMDLRERMKAVVEGLRSRIESNNDFIEKSVVNLQGVASQLTATVTGRGANTSSPSKNMSVYNGKAKYQPSSGQPTGTLVEKRF